MTQGNISNRSPLVPQFVPQFLAQFLAESRHGNLNKKHQDNLKHIDIKTCSTTMLACIEIQYSIIFQSLYCNSPLGTVLVSLSLMGLMNAAS